MSGQKKTFSSSARKIRKKVIRDPSIDESYIRIEHPCGLLIQISQKPFQTCCATLRVLFGEMHTQYRLKGRNTVHSIPRGTAHFLEHKMFEDENGNDLFNAFAVVVASAEEILCFCVTLFCCHCEILYSHSGILFCAVSVEVAAGEIVLRLCPALCCGDAEILHSLFKVTLYALAGIETASHFILSRSISLCSSEHETLESVLLSAISESRKTVLPALFSVHIIGYIKSVGKYLLFSITYHTVKQLVIIRC